MTDVPAAPGDRILLIGIPAAEKIRDLARCVPVGLVVGAGDPDSVAQARLALADLDNVMFHRLTPDGLPWRDGHFDKIVWQRSLWANEVEVRRTLAPGGSIHEA